MTVIHRVIFAAGAWMPRPTPLRAIMPITVDVVGETHALVPDLCHAVANALAWGEYGENVIPEDAAPRGTLSGDDGIQVSGGLVITTDPNQPAPDYGDGDDCPAVSEVRLLLTQPITDDLADLNTFIHRRREICSVLGALTGVLAGEPELLARPWSNGWGVGFGPLYEDGSP